MMRNIIGQIESSFDLRDVMDNKKILLVNLSKGRTGELNSRLLGMMFVMKFQAAAMSRANIPEDDRVDFALYVDEFQNFSTDSFATIMSEARKYHLNLIVANQFTTQLTEEIRDAVFGNMGTIVSFRIGQNDVESLSKYFQPLFGGDDLLRVPNYNTIVRTLINGVPTQPFSMATIPPLGEPSDELGQALKQLSSAKFGRPRQVVEKEVFSRLKTVEEKLNKPALGPAGQASNQRVSSGNRAAASTPKQGASFLDQWLDKRQKEQHSIGTTTTPPAAQPNKSPQKQTPEPITKQRKMVRSNEPNSKNSQKSPETDSPAKQQKKEDPTILKVKRETPVKTEKPSDEFSESSDTIRIDNEGNLQQKNK
jgi:hypothetical protein